MPKPEMTTVGELAKEFQNDYGVGAAKTGDKYEAVERIPSGVLSFDVATGGGFPKGKISEVFGKEHSGKTTLVLKAIAMNQKIKPDETNVFIDMEGTFEGPWFERLGGDPKELLVLKPLYAEQACDMLYELVMQAEDVGVIALDSIAALMSTAELDASAEKKFMGGAAQEIGKMIRKSLVALTKAEHEERKPTLILLNQVRQKMGMVFGDPETTPGGDIAKFMSTLRVRLYGKAVMDSKVSKTKPSIHATTGAIKKCRANYTRREFEYDMIVSPHKGLLPGQIDDWGYIEKNLEQYGLKEKGPGGKGWVIMGENYKTITECKERFMSDPDFADEARARVVSLVFDNEAMASDG